MMIYSKLIKIFIVIFQQQNKKVKPAKIKISPIAIRKIINQNKIEVNGNIKVKTSVQLVSYFEIISRRL